LQLLEDESVGFFDEGIVHGLYLRIKAYIGQRLLRLIQK